MNTLRFLKLLSLCGYVLLASQAISEARPNYSLATFVAEVTPPLGHPLQAGMGVKPVMTVADPLLAHGFVLLGGGQPIVVVSVDWCGIGNEAHDRWRIALAEAAETTPERVLVCAIHQHDAPLADLEAERLIGKLKLESTTLDLDWHEQTVKRVAQALKSSLKSAKPITHVGTGEAKVEGVASNRRILGKDGKVELFRGSAMKDPKAKEAPEGLIDPLLKTVSFWNGEKAVASLSVYATHPMSHYGQGNVSSDFTGLARRRRQAEDPGVLHFYANGCGGDIAAGKYNDGSPEARVQLTDRIYKAWKAAWLQTKKRPLNTIEFRSIPLRLSPKNTEGFQAKDLEAILKGDKSPYAERVRAAYALSWRQRCDAKKVLDLPVIDFGSTQLLLLPGEPFVEYQLFAQKLRPDSFVVTLGYGDYGPSYVPTDKAFAEGGYEPGGWSFVAPGVELQLKEGIKQALKTKASDRGLQLATGDKAACAIVTGVKPTAEEATAAEWLAKNLEQVTGAAFSVLAEDSQELPKQRIYVGNTEGARRLGINAEKLKAEEWLIRTTTDALILAGGQPRGVIYSVCEFLEAHVGVARLDPFTDVIPQKPYLTIPTLNRQGSPAFPTRAMFTGFPYIHTATSGTKTRLFHVWNKNVIDGIPAHGDYPRYVPDGVHTFGKFISAKEFGATHPEYFSMDAEGKRMTNDLGTGVLWIQLCVTSEEVRRITLERARIMLRADQEEARKTGRQSARFLVLSQNDNTSNLCLCPQCQAVSQREGSESGALLDYVNFVARRIRDEFPEVIVLTEAYNFTLNVPKTIRPESNVMVRYCDNYGFSDPTRPLADPRNAKPKALFDGWTKAAHHLAVWDYWRVFQAHPPGFYAPSVNIRAIQEDLRLFKKKGVQYLSVETEDFLGGGINDDPASEDLQSFMPLRTWIGFKLFDNPGRELEPLLQTFFNGYYGPAAQPMRQLLELIEQKQAAIPERIVDLQRHSWVNKIGDAAFFSKAYGCLDAAMQLSASDPAWSTHVRRERLILDSAYLWTEASVKRRDPQNAAVLPKRADVVRRHRDDWSVYVASIFDEAGLKQVLPIVERGRQLVEKLKSEDTDTLAMAVSATEDQMTLDGKLSEGVWQRAPLKRLLPRNPESPNDNATTIRYAWTAQALYVAIEHPAAGAAAAWDCSLMESSRKGIQLSLYCQATGTIGAYFYTYSPEGYLQAVKDRRSQSKIVTVRDQEKVTSEIRIPWADLSFESKAGAELLLNVGAYPKADSPAATYVSSPWLIGKAPPWNSAYYGGLKLAE